MVSAPVWAALLAKMVLPKQALSWIDQKTYD